MKQFIITIISFALLCGCGGRSVRYEDKHEHNHTAAHDHEGCDHDRESHSEAPEEHTGEIIFTRAQASAAGDFALHRVEPVTFHEVIPCGGQILAAQGDEARVVAAFNGIVSFAGKRMAAGTAVGKGETLFYISSREIAEGDHAARTEAAYRQAKAAFERAESLVGDRIVTQAEYEEAKRNYETARAAREALGDRISTRGTAVGAPLGGYVTNVAVTEGQYVEVGQMLATVSQNRRLTLRADVPQRHATAVHGVSGAHFRTPYDGKTYSLAELNGRLLSVGRMVEAGSAYIPVTFEFDNRGEVLSGFFVEVFLTGSPRKDALTVPLTALSEEQGFFFVFRQLDEEGYLKQGVIPGGNDGRSVEILSGLNAGDVVVSRGAALVRMASFSGTVPHGHSH